jgi:heme/copper-type cytochrome/quinol oxidase subunit 4
VQCTALSSVEQSEIHLIAGMQCVFQLELFLKMKDTRTHLSKCVLIILNVSMAITRTVVVSFIEQLIFFLFSISLNTLSDS